MRSLELCLTCFLQRTLLPQPVREVVKPDNQMQLTEAEMEEEIAKMLTANNPAGWKSYCILHAQLLHLLCTSQLPHSRRATA